jgi:hypothetical protein
MEVIRCENVDWIHLAKYRDRWRALVVNTEMNLLILQNEGGFLDQFRDY